jgi:hypothetical protein
MGIPFKKIVRTTVGGVTPAVKAALGLDATATEADCVRAIEMRKAAIADLKAETIAVRLEKREQEYANQSYVKRGVVDAMAEHRATVTEAARQELAKLRATDVGTATTEPRVASGPENFNPDRPTSAYQQLRQMAEQHRAAGRKLSIEQAFSEVYADPRNRDLVARERAERESGASYLDKLPEL